MEHKLTEHTMITRLLGAGILCSAVMNFIVLPITMYVMNKKLMKSIREGLRLFLDTAERVEK